MAKKKDDTEKKEKKKRQGIRLGVSKEEKLRLIPPFVMLAAGATGSILMVVQGRYELHEFLRNLLLILFFFYILGCLLKGTLDLIEKQNRPPEPEEEEEVIKKESEDAETEEGEAAEEQAIDDHE